MTQILKLYRFLVQADDTKSFPGVLRQLEQITIEQIAPALRDPIVQEHAVAYTIRKRTNKPPETACGLSLSIVAPPEGEAVVAASVRRHLIVPANALEVTWDDLLLHPICADYRRGLRETTDVALDLHCDVQHLRDHQCMLIDLACSGADPRAALHAYFTEHSPAYASRSAPPQAPGHQWRHEEFWTRLFTPGPAVSLWPPVTSLWNIVVGTKPRRGHDPTLEAAAVGIECR